MRKQANHRGGHDHFPRQMRPSPGPEQDAKIRGFTIPKHVDFFPFPLKKTGGAREPLASQAPTANI